MKSRHQHISMHHYFVLNGLVVVFDNVLVPLSSCDLDESIKVVVVLSALLLVAVDDLILTHTFLSNLTLYMEENLKSHSLAFFEHIYCCKSHIYYS